MPSEASADLGLFGGAVRGLRGGVRSYGEAAPCAAATKTFFDMLSSMVTRELTADNL